jgi:hypothetical protein
MSARARELFAAQSFDHVMGTLFLIADVPAIGGPSYPLETGLIARG